jgi:PIN domain nuclease of toxin-antitoxin system
MPVSGSEAVGYFVEAGFELLPVTAEHAARTETLPTHHADPFDRLLLAQALHEPMHLVTHDATLGNYDVTVLLI